MTYKPVTNAAAIPRPPTIEIKPSSSEPDLLLPRAKTKRELRRPSVYPPPTVYSSGESTVNLTTEYPFLPSNASLAMTAACEKYGY
jgi:hypothetical protein